MLRPVDLNNKLCLGNEEINNVPAELPLTVNVLRNLLEKIIPKVLLFPRHVLAELICKRSQLRVVLHAHCERLLWDRSMNSANAPSASPLVGKLSAERSG